MRDEEQATPCECCGETKCGTCPNCQEPLCSGCQQACDYAYLRHYADDPPNEQEIAAAFTRAKEAVVDYVKAKFTERRPNVDVIDHLGGGLMIDDALLAVADGVRDSIDRVAG